MQLTSDHATKLLMNLSGLGNSNVTTPNQSGPTLCASATTKAILLSTYIVTLNLPKFVVYVFSIVIVGDEGANPSSPPITSPGGHFVISKDRID